jgi:hypothetical protein
MVCSEKTKELQKYLVLGYEYAAQDAELSYWSQLGEGPRD